MSGSVDVLIAGAGPTGLAAANLLGLAGLEVVVVEREQGIADSPRAVSIDDEGLRIVQACGLLAAARGVIVAGTGTRYYGVGRRLLAHAHGPLDNPLGHPVKNPVDHQEFQGLLLDGLRRFSNVHVRFGVELESFEQDETGVSAELVVDGGVERLRATYLLGADGGRSTARRLLGVSMTGRSHGERWLIVDTLNDPHRVRYAMHHGDPQRPHVVIPGRAGRCRYEFLLFGESDEEATDPGFVSSVMAPHRGELQPEDIVRCTVFTFHSLVAETWREGRVFLMGDAAHMMPPFAGQGLNSGLRDALNLAWKLELVVGGLAEDSMLDSYQVEREPSARGMIRLSERLGRVMMTTSRARARVRDALMRAGDRLPWWRSYVGNMRFKPAPRYRAGLLVQSGLGGRLLPQPRALLAGGEIELLDDVIGPRFALIAIEPANGEFPALVDPVWDELDAARIVLRVDEYLPAVPSETEGVVVAADVDELLPRSLGDVRDTVLVVRPDRFVFGAFAGADESAVAASLRHALRPGSASALPETRSAKRSRDP